MWYQKYEDKSHPIFPFVSERLRTLTGQNVSSEFVLKVTWENMAPASPSQKSEVRCPCSYRCNEMARHPKS